MERQKIRYIIKSQMSEKTEPKYYAIAEDRQLFDMLHCLRGEMECYKVEVRHITKRDDELEDVLSGYKLWAKERQTGLRMYYERQPLVQLA